MKRIGIGMVVLLTLFAAVGLFHTAQPAVAQDDQATQGWLEGVILNEDSQALNAIGVNALRDGQSVAYSQSDGGHGGLYRMMPLRPGVYEVMVNNAFQDKLRPQRIFGVVVKPGVRTVLNITLHEGKGIEEIGQPAVATQRVIIISEELENLQRQIDELKKKNP